MLGEQINAIPKDSIMKTGIVFLFIISLSTQAFGLTRTCGSHEPTLVERVAIKASTGKINLFQSKLIKTVVHYISEDDLDQTAVDEQMNVLNEAFRVEGFQFELEKTNVISDEDTIRAFRRSRGSADVAKAELHEGDVGTLNIYLAKIGGLLGWATFPWNVQDRPLIDGVVVEITTLPGGSNAPYNLGQTLTHEVGHWLGLYHTFQGGCSDKGDLIADTPSHGRPTYGCPEASESNCNGVTENIPVSNFMNYTDDACMTEFTALQGDRMQSAFAIYRKDFETLPF